MISTYDEKTGISTIKDALEYFVKFFNELDFVAIVDKIIAFFEKNLGSNK